jgi:hypothetical protein
VEWLKELGFDHAFNYKKVTVRKVGIQVLLVQTIIKRFKATSNYYVPWRNSKTVKSLLFTVHFPEK